MTDILRLAVAAVLEADKEFRANMPPEWEGDPLSDEIDGLRRVFMETTEQWHARRAREEREEGREQNALSYEAFGRAATHKLSAALSRPIDPKAEVEPVAWFMHLWNEADEDVRSDVRWGKPTVADIEYAEHNGHDIEYLFASPSIVALTPAERDGDHPDDRAVDRFAAAMKAKLSKKRNEGRGGWEDKGQCSNAFLSKLLLDHVEKGDPVDVGNLAMMIHQRGERVTSFGSPIVHLNAIVDAWEALQGGRQVRNRDVEAWLAKDMAPAINAIRGFLRRPKPDGTLPAPDASSCDLASRLRATTEEMASQVSVDMGLWDRHSNACLAAVAALAAQGDDAQEGTR